MTGDINLINEFIKNSIFRLEENTEKINKCLEDLTEEEVWKRPNASSNSVGNLILHLCGNMTQYVISSLGGKEDTRERDKEFSASGGHDKRRLMEKLTATIDEVVGVLRNVKEDDLLQFRSVQGFEYSGAANIVHVVEHFSYHTGQIAFWVKLLKDKDLGFYEGMDLNIKNKD